MPAGTNERECHCLGVGQPDENRADESRSLGHCDAIDPAIAHAGGIAERLAHHKSDVPQVLAPGQF